MKFINKIPNTNTWVVWNSEDIPNWSNTKGFIITLLVVVSVIGGIWLIGGLIGILGWIISFFV